MTRRARLSLVVFLALLGVLVALSAWAWNVSKPVWHSADVETLTFTHDGEWLLTGDVSGALKLWRTDDLLRGRGFGFHTLAAASITSGAGVRCVGMSPVGHRALVGFGDGRLELWDLDARRRVHSLRRDGEPVTAVAIGPDGKTGISGTECDLAGRVGPRHSTVSLWDCETGTELAFVKLASVKETVRRVELSPNGKLALVTVRVPFAGRHDESYPSFKLFDVPSLTLRRELEAVGRGKEGHFSLGGERVLALGQVDDRVRCWSTVTGEELPHIKCEPASWVETTLDRGVVAHQAMEGLVLGLRSTDFAEAWRLELPPAAKDRVLVGVAPGGHFVAEAFGDGSIRVTPRRS